MEKKLSNHFLPIQINYYQEISKVCMKEKEKALVSKMS